MPQIAALTDRLDAQPGRKEVVGYWELRNADPQDVKVVLQTLFNRGISAQSDNSTLLGQNNPLTARQNKQPTTTTTASPQLGNTGSSAPQMQ